MTISQTHETGAYLLWMGGSALLACLWLMISRRRKLPAGTAAALSGLTLLLGALLGVLGARLVYILCRINMLSSLAEGGLFLPLRAEEMSYYGGVAGVILAVFLAARILKLPAGETLNAFAPMGAFLAAMARFAEGFLGFVGVGIYLEEETAFPLAVRFAWDGDWYEYYLAVFLFEGVFSLIACALSLRHREEKDRLLRTLFYLCLPQILLESLRTGGIFWRFVRAEQLGCFLLCEAVLIRYALKTDRRSFQAWRPALAGLLLCAVVIVGEFALDGKITLPEEEMIPKAVIYGCVAACLALTAAEEHRGHRKLYGSGREDAA